MRSSHLLSRAAALLLATAAACACADNNNDYDAVRIVEAIAPNAKSCPADNQECRTAAQAAPFIADSMTTWALGSVNQMAAVVSLMAFESADFRYKRNKWPGRPGQGTANMQMARYNLLYARAIDALRPQVANMTTVDGQGDDKLNWLVSLVSQPDEYNFGSGAWFLATQCPQDVRDELARDADRGFARYMGCVGVSVTDDRKAYFERAKKAFGITA
ncbi:hypothetical protein AAL_01645 [Moelleriella libera RCEF 2490]|uniref:Uncharacterized protein n=1 Tax=Moelleriella libera RCEF 2490 TaxID=1081109 RepID=A0A166UBR5_9HYPO|nr:hypothetical protein AAL_01645 [Moelleriella libera RCEF 2490]